LIERHDALSKEVAAMVKAATSRNGAPDKQLFKQLQEDADRGLISANSLADAAQRYGPPLPSPIA